jgi:hypothetical protein
LYISVCVCVCVCVRCVIHSTYRLFMRSSISSSLFSFLSHWRSFFFGLHPWEPNRINPHGRVGRKKDKKWGEPNALEEMAIGEGG